jgi:hypothetical protein
MHARFARHLGLLVVLALLTFACAATRGAGVDAAGDKVKLLIVTGGHNFDQKAFEKLFAEKAKVK